MRSIRCQQAPKVHFIDRDLTYALCPAGYLVVMDQGRLPLNMRAKLGMLRLMKRSGGTQSGSENSKTVGANHQFNCYHQSSTPRHHLRPPHL